MSNKKINISRTSNLGITQDYNKENRDKLWDDNTAKKKFKKKQFDGKKTIEDPISGEVLHINQSAAQKKYHMKDSEGNNISQNWGKHSAETDHVNAIKDVHKIVKKNAFISDGDFKEIINDEKNYRLLSKTMNTSKGDQKDFSLIKDGVKKKDNVKGKGNAHYDDNELTKEAKKILVHQNIKASAELHKKFAVKTAQNIGGEFVSGAAYSVYDSVIPLASEGVRRAVQVAQGKADAKEVAKDLGKTTLEIATKGGGRRIATTALTNTLEKQTQAMVREIINSPGMSQIIAAAVIVCESSTKYLNGEINGDEFINEIGEKGAVMITGMIGGEIGGKLGEAIGFIIGTAVLPGVGTTAGMIIGDFVGKLIGSMITAAACSLIISTINTNKELNLFKLKEKQIRRITSQALHEIENQRLYFRNVVEREFNIWDETIENGFDQLLYYTCEETYSFEGVTEGLDKILSVFGKEVQFKTLDDYRAQLKQPIIW